MGTVGSSLMKSPIASNGTKEMDTKQAMGKVQGTPDHKGTPDPLGYVKGDSK